MNAQPVPASLRRKGVTSIRWWNAFDCFSVVLKDGRLGKGATIKEAVQAANEPDAENVRRAA